jgi:hypothetical protein
MRTTFTLLATGAFVVFGAVGCDQQSTNSLEGPTVDYWATSQAATHQPAPSHMAQIVGSGVNGITDPQVKVVLDAQLGTPDQVARMHGTQKIQYAMLGSFLNDLGAAVSTTTTQGSEKKGGGGTTTPTVPTAASLYSSGSTALGAPIYLSRTPEMVIPSTAALAKEYDIFMAAAPSILTGITNSTRCPGVALVTSGELTADGISCIMGKPALPDHVTLAQQIVASASDTTTGQEIAIATLMAAAHISE